MPNRAISLTRNIYIRIWAIRRSGQKSQGQKSRVRHRGVAPFREHLIQPRSCQFDGVAQRLEEPPLIELQ
jgi:hypothetical protein